jgi:hypothetical protein
VRLWGGALWPPRRRAWLWVWGESSFLHLMAKRRPLQLDGIEVLTDGDRRWKRRVEEIQLDALPATRRSAERWAASISAILGTLGIAAVLAGPDQFVDLASPWREIGKLALFLGAALSFAALWTAGLAAHATAQKLLLPTGAEMRRVSGRAVNDALARLETSRICTAIAVVAVLAAALCVWWAPRHSRSSSLECRYARTAESLPDPPRPTAFRCRLFREGSRATSDQAGGL